MSHSRPRLSRSEKEGGICEGIMINFKCVQLSLNESMYAPYAPAKVSFHLFIVTNMLILQSPMGNTEQVNPYHGWYAMLIMVADIIVVSNFHHPWAQIAHDYRTRRHIPCISRPNQQPEGKAIICEQIHWLSMNRHRSMYKQAASSKIHKHKLHACAIITMAGRSWSHKHDPWFSSPRFFWLSLNKKTF